jgi:hypothetical protein
LLPEVLCGASNRLRELSRLYECFRDVHCYIIARGRGPWEGGR